MDDVMDGEGGPGLEEDLSRDVGPPAVVSRAVSTSPTVRAPRASPEERRHAEFLLLEHMRSRSGWTGTRGLCDFLERGSEWGTYGSVDGRRRTVQNWLCDLRALPANVRGFECRETAKGYEYRRDSRPRLSMASACMALLVERLIEPLVPADYVQSDLSSLFGAARDSVAASERSLGRNGDAVGHLVKRIAVAPRGQQLVERSISRDIAAAVTDAILRRRQLNARYGGRSRQLHPYGLILREPKFYLLAVEDAALLADPVAPPRLYLCSRFRELAVGEARNRVPDDFVVGDWIAAGGLDVRLQGVDAGQGAPFELVLRVHGLAGNLVTDLADFPLSSHQSIERHPDEDACTLRASHMRATEALLEWILGRAERVEVDEPAFLRAKVAERIETMAARYRVDAR